MFLVLRFVLTSPIFQLFIGIPRGSPDCLNRQKSVESVEAIILPMSCYFPCLPPDICESKNLDRPFKKTQLMQNPWLKLSVTDLLNGETIVKKPHVCFQKFGPPPFHVFRQAMKAMKAMKTAKLMSKGALATELAEAAELKKSDVSKAWFLDVFG